MVAVIECILNQNARDAGAATFPAISTSILDLCKKHDIGILQMPCPEIYALGFERERKPGQSIRDALDTPKGRQCCRKISVDIVDRIEIYTDHGYQILSILGGNPESPGCAVHVKDGRLLPHSGVFMKELEDELYKRSVKIPFIGMRDYDPELFAQDIQQLKSVFS